MFHEESGLRVLERSIMRQKNWIQTIFSFAKACKWKMILSVLFAIFSVAGSILPYIGVYQIIILFFNETQTISNVLYWCGICVAGYVIKIAFYGISTTLSHISAYTILESMRLEIARKLMRAPLGTVLNQSVGKIKNVVIDRVETIELPLAHMIPEGLSYLLMPISVFIYLSTINFGMAIASILTVPIAAVVYAIMMRGFGKKYEEYMESSNYVNGVMVEYVEGIEVIKAFNQSTSSYEKFEKAVIEFRESILEWFRSTWKLMNLGGAILPTTLLGTLPIGLYFYITGFLNPADYVMCMILSMGIVAPLTSFTVFVNDIKSIEFAVRDADEFLNLEEMKDCNTKAIMKNYNIKFENVSFAYEKADKDFNLVLKNMNLEIEEGKFTAIVGPSGGGKSTAAKLIARFWDVAEGKILIGNTEIKNIPFSQLNDMVSFVTQDNFLFNCSIKENIRLGNPYASDEEVIEASKAACCHEFLLELENGYETDAGTAGAKLSGGEKQRIAIARAILKNAPIVILDEATAFTDPENEDMIQKSIGALTKGKTLIVIAHRLSTIKNANKIVVLKDGKIEEQGTHEELLNHCILYKNMWNAHIGSKNWAAKGGEA